MFKKSLMMAASAAIVTCGAMGAANAGELKLTLRDVNVNLSGNPDLSKHTDTDIQANGSSGSVDLNGFSGPNGSVAPRNSRSIDKGFIPVFKPDIGPNGFTFEHVVLADERMGGVDNPVGGFYEIDVFEVTGAATFSEVTRFDIEIGGSALPMFKEDVNCANAIRAGSDNIHSLSANTASGGQSIHVGEMTANCNVTVSQGGPSTLPDRSIGWVLPIETKACGDLIVSMTVTRQDPVLGGQIVDTFSHVIQECRDSLEAKFGGETVKIDYFTDFRSFLLGDLHTPSLWARVGEVTLDIHHWLVDLKENNKQSHTNVFDVSDIHQWRLTLQFGNLRGIKSVEIGGRQADVLDRVANEAQFTFTNQELRNLFCLVTADGDDKGDTDWGCVQPVKIHAFGPHDGNVNNGPIDHQLILVEVSELDLTPTTCTGAHCVKFFSPEEEGEGALLAELVKTGINFGPFDWVADNNSPAISVFRVTGIPTDDIDDLKGLVIVENASDGEMFDATYKVDFLDSQVVNGEYLLTSQRIADLLAAAGMPDGADWGRADLTFTFFVPGDLGIKMDMDRLMNTNGVLSSYGDNSNDAFSLKARSCDDGRFGPHVANKLDPRFTATLTYICGLGEIDRSRVLYNVN